MGPITAVVTICASIMGVIVAADGLIASTRNRKLAEFLKMAAEAEDDGSPLQTVLISLRREMVARVVGGSAVPFRRMIGSVAVLVVACGGVFLSTWVILISREASVSGWRWFLLILGCIFCIGLGVGASTALIRRLDERRRIADDYLAGRTPLTPSKFYFFDEDRGVTWSEVFNVAFISFGLLATSGLLAFDIHRIIAFPLTPGAAMVFISSLPMLRSYLSRRRGSEWKHPYECRDQCKVKDHYLLDSSMVM